MQEVSSPVYELCLQSIDFKTAAIRYKGDDIISTLKYIHTNMPTF